jgi:hypothetical protein
MVVRSVVILEDSMCGCPERFSIGIQTPGTLAIMEDWSSSQTRKENHMDDNIKQGLPYLLGYIAGESMTEVADRIGQGEQANMVHLDRFPVKMKPDREAYESLGFRFGEQIDQLFVKVTLPDGWKLQATGHYTHTCIMDAHNRRRGGVFFKPDFWDKKARAWLIPRYSVDIDYSSEEYETLRKQTPSLDNPLDIFKHVHYTATVLDHNGAAVWQEGPISPEEAGWNPAVGNRWPEFRYELQRHAENWLDTNKPNWRDVTAYWDD